MSCYSAEYIALTECYPTLVTCLQQSPSDFVVQLRPTGILAPKDVAFLRNPHHDDDSKAERIVDVVISRVKNNVEEFNCFTRALRAAGPWTERAVKELEQMCRTLTSNLVRGDEKMRLMMPEPTLEELCALPVEKVWYQLGLWLGVDEMMDLNKYWRADEMFETFLQSFFSRKDYTEFIAELPLECREVLSKFFLDNDPTLAQECKAIIDNNSASLSAKDNGQKLIDDKLSKLSKRGTVVNALVKVGLHKEAKKTFISKVISFSTYLDLTDPANNPPDYILEYASYLKRKYKEMSIVTDDWPPSTTADHKYSQLALISASKPIHHHAVESTEKDYLHGNIDRIVAQKESITLDELFYPIINKANNSSRLTILMDGAPGVGKTTIARKLCIDWANGDLLQEYQLVVYVPLREAVGDSVASLLPWPVSTNKADKVAEYLEQLTILGKNTLFIFDGFDELSIEDRSRKSLFIRIIKGEILPDCSVLVASRPYASSKSLGSLSRINKHVEILGFTKLEIELFIVQSLSSIEAAQTLIEMLRERLDIFSLCYIPLNCKIVLFVFEQQQYKLPTTLTELYETFILHTIKRSMEKDEKEDLECNVDCIDNLPLELLSNLDDLCKVAFDCLCKDQLYLKIRNLVNGKECLSLGLLNCLQVMNSRSLPEEHYHFLHLTIQEFLAARYLASDKYTEDRHKFLLEHIDDVRYRMTFLFLAGLTKLNFIPINTSLLGDQTINLTPKEVSRDDWAPEERNQQKLMLVAHLLFESQVKSLRTPLAFQANILAIANADRLSPFAQLVLAHFLSSTPKAHIWNKIYVSGKDLPSDFILYTTTLSDSETIAIGMTKYLRLSEVTLPRIDQIISTSFTLRELYCSNSLGAFWHDEIVQVCSTISGSQTLETVQICERANNVLLEISPSKKIYVKYLPELCSISLIKLLEFVKGNSLECIEITNSKAFQDCVICELFSSQKSQVVDSFCEVEMPKKNAEQICLESKTAKEVSTCISCPEAFQACACTPISVTTIKVLCGIIKLSKSLKSVTLRDCKLNEYFMEMIVSSLVESPSDSLESILLSGNDINAKSVSKLLQISTNKIIKVYNCLVNLDGDHLTLFCGKTSQLYHLLGVLACPSNIKYLTASLTEHNVFPILDLDILTFLLAANPNIIEINLPSMRFRATCSGSLTFTKALLAHSSVQRISFQQAIHTISSLRQALDIEHLNSIICPNALPNLLAFITPEEVEIINMYGNFKNCRSCGSGGELAQQSFVECLTKCVNLKELHLTHIPEGMIGRVLSLLSKNEKLQLLDIPDSCPTADSLTLILRLTAFSLTKLCVGDVSVTVQDHTSILIRCLTCISYSYLNTLLQSLLRMPDSQLRRFTFDNSVVLTDYHIKDFVLFLRHSEGTVEFLNFSGSRVSSNLMEDLIHWVKLSTTLKELHLKSLRLFKKTVTLLLEALVENRTLKHLDLSSNYLAWYCETSNQIVGPGVALQKLLEKNQGLSVLKLGKCHLPQSVIHHIAIGLMSNTTLTELDLSGHSILERNESEKFGQSIEAILTRNQSLQILSLSSCQFTEVVMSYIAKALTNNSTLNKFYLDKVFIKYPHHSETLFSSAKQSWLTLFSALKQNSSLHTLSICGNRFDEKEFSALRELLHHSTTLTTLKVVNCGFSDTELKTISSKKCIETYLAFSQQEY